MKLIKFKQENCTPCKMLDDYLKGIEVEVDKVINLSNPSSDEDLMMAGMYGIEKTPTLVLVDSEGVLIEKFKGVGQKGVNSILSKRGLI